MTNLFGYAFLAVPIACMVRKLGLYTFQIGLVFATSGGGALIGAMIAGRCAICKLIAGQLGFGLIRMLEPLAVLAPGFALLLVVLAKFLQWLTSLISVVNSRCFRQRVTNDEMQGRSHDTFAALTYGFQSIG